MTKLFVLTIPVGICITFAFMLMTMASGIEARMESDLGIGSSANSASSGVISETTVATNR